MEKKPFHISPESLARFDRHFFDSQETFTCIGSGALGGKASGLAFIREILRHHFNSQPFPDIAVNVPTLTVITTEYFDIFMKQNNLFDIAFSDMRDDQIALAFQKGELPGELVGDLRALISHIHTPLAIRSSSLLEDAIYEPFAGVYGTKMIPNNQFDTDIRFRKLVEAIKFVFASTFFSEAKNYIKMTKHSAADEKMAVIIQEVVGCRYESRFYPNLSGVGRSYNFYPTGHAKPEDGVVDLALGLGKTIVDGGRVWTLSPAYPRANPPHNSPRELSQYSQTEFWAVNMGKPPEYDPIHETEYLQKGNLNDAEIDGTLRFVASTYQLQDDKIVTGIGSQGTRLVTFAPILKAGLLPLTELLKTLLTVCKETVGSEVEIEFAMTLDSASGIPARFGFLQVRPMVVSYAGVEVTPEELVGDNVLAASEQILGNAAIDNIFDIIYVKPDNFNAAETRMIASEISSINQEMVASGRPYLLIGFGRWGSSESWLGIPVDWSQISGARAIVEATLPEMNVDLSQGSHFFHNLTSFQICYFSVPHTGKYQIDWKWLNSQRVAADTEHVRHLTLDSPLRIKVDGKSGRGVILK
jgi:hypothetical protein